MKYRWSLKSVQAECVENLCANLGFNKYFAIILVSRGIYSEEQAKDFLKPQLKNMHDPALFPEMPKAIARICQAIEQKQKIFLYGDFDVDGVTSTALLYQCLQLVNADVGYYIPDRRKEGYGLNIEAMNYLHQQHAKLIVTVDCGISAHDAIKEAKRLGIDTIVTDHHELGKDLPEAYAIINPKDFRSNYPFHGIAGVGVAFKLAWAICQECSPTKDKVLPCYREFLLDAMALVALGTISDVAPLCDENRIMARYGLLALENTKNIGIKALKEVANVSQVSPLTSEHVGFRLGPRINAMGRLENSCECVKLLTTKNYERAHELAKDLERKNQKRRSIQEKIYKQAKEQIKNKGLENKKVFTLAYESWHPGVVGIVASRLQEEYYRPVLMIALQNGEGRGSARSIPGFHLFEALQACAPCLLNYGGHEMAAGFKIAKDKITDLDKLLNQRAEEVLTQQQMQPLLEIDVIVDLQDITWELFHQIEKMAPFGEANPRPILAVKKVEIVNNPSPERYGAKGEHLGFRVRKNKSVFRSIAFGYGMFYERLLTLKNCDLAFTLRKNSWAGVDSIELEVKDIQPAV